MGRREAVCLAREPGNQSQFSRFCVLSSFVFMVVFMGGDAVFVNQVAAATSPAPTVATLE